MRQKRAGTAIAPRSNVHIHTVTLGESMDHKDYRREDRDQPEERKDQQDAHEEKRQGFTARKKRDSTQVARCLRQRRAGRPLSRALMFINIL